MLSLFSSCMTHAWRVPACVCFIDDCADIDCHLQSCTVWLVGSSVKLFVQFSFTYLCLAEFHITGPKSHVHFVRRQMGTTSRKCHPEK
jgi:hypothetical protein